MKIFSTFVTDKLVAVSVHNQHRTGCIMQQSSSVTVCLHSVELTFYALGIFPEFDSPPAEFFFLLLQRSKSRLRKCHSDIKLMSAFRS